MPMAQRMAEIAKATFTLFAKMCRLADPICAWPMVNAKSTVAKAKLVICPKSLIVAKDPEAMP